VDGSGVGSGSSMLVSDLAASLSDRDGVNEAWTRLSPGVR